MSCANPPCIPLLRRSAPEHSRLASALAFELLSDAAAGITLLCADPRTAPADEIDEIEVLGTAPMAFSAA